MLLTLRAEFRLPKGTLILIRKFCYTIGSLCVLFGAGMAQAQSSSALDAEQQLFLTLINNFRAQNGLGSLQVSVTLQNASQWMSSDMAARKYFNHTDSTGRDPFARMAAFGYSFSPAGENIAAGNAGAQATFSQWEGSPGHRSNMLNASYKVIGIGRAYNSSAPYGWYWTTDFGGYVDQVLGSPAPNPIPTPIPTPIPSPTPQPTLSDSALLFVPVQPCRVADTRFGQTAAGSFSAATAVPGGLIRTLAMQGVCGVPAAARAFSLNVTAVPQQPLGFLTIWPAGQAQPSVSTLNSPDGRVKASAAIVAAGTNGSVNVFLSNPSDVIVDINGYFVAPGDPAGLAFYPVTPCRVVDTRDATRGALGSPGLVANGTRSFNLLAATGCNISPAARAYSLNYTVVPSGPLGYLSTWSTGKTQPPVSTLNSPTGTVTANAAIVPTDSGSVEVLATNSTDLVIDINGYFAPPGGPNALSFYNLSPCRVLDTRVPSGTAPSTGGRLGINPSTCGAPATSKAYVFGATVVPAGALGYLTLWGNGTTQPSVSTLNASDGAVTSNMAIVPSVNGLVNAFVSGYSHLILDVSGYFAP